MQPCFRAPLRNTSGNSVDLLSKPAGPNRKDGDAGRLHEELVKHGRRVSADVIGNGPHSPEPLASSPRLVASGSQLHQTLEDTMHKVSPSAPWRRLRGSPIWNAYE
jgi:hypothetical protein